MNPVTYESPDEVYKRLKENGIQSSSDIIQRAIQGYYSQQTKPSNMDRDAHTSRDGNVTVIRGDKTADTQIKRHAIRKSLEGIE